MPKEIFGPHIGGISEDDSLTGKGANQVLYTENLDITSNTKYVNLSRKPTEYISLPDKTVSMEYINGYMLICDNDKNLYRNGTIVWTEERIIRIWSNSTYLFMLDSGENIHRMLLSDMTQSNWSTYITQTETNLESSIGPFYIIPLEDITYLAYEKNLYIIDNTTGYKTVDEFNFISNNIKGITILGTQIKIYQENGMLLLWNGVGNDGISERIDLGIKISSVHQIANIDYVVSSGNVGYMNGYTWQPLLNTFYSDELQSNKISIERNTGVMGITHLKGIFYLLGDNSNLNLGDGTTEFGTNDCIITYGNKKQGFPSAINRFLTTASTGYKYADLQGVYVSSSSDTNLSDILYVAYKDTEDNYGVDKYNLYDGKYTPIQDKGIIVYNNFDAQTPHQKKKIKSVTVVGDIKDGDNIKLYYIDDSRDSGDNLVPLPNKGDTLNYVFEQGDDSSEFEYTKPFDMTFYNITLAIVLTNTNNLIKNQGLRYYNLILDYEAI